MLKIEEISGLQSITYQNLYEQLNPQLLPEVDAKTAAQFLKKSGLNVVHLSQIWEFADYRKIGFLDKLGCYIAFKLVAGIQQGFPIDIHLLNNSNLEPPKFLNNLNSSSTTSLPTAAQDSVQNLKQRSSSLAAKNSFGDWEIDAADQSKYETIFYSLKPINGKVSGEQCRPVFLNSQIPQNQLAKIWELSDIDKDGFLDKYEMCIALHLVYKCLQNKPLPSYLPVSLIHPMKRVQCSSVNSSLQTNLPQKMSESRQSSLSSINIASPQSQKKNSATMSKTASNVSLPKISRNLSITSDDIFKSIFDASSANTDWTINVSNYIELFNNFDSDQDGLVNGTDIRTYLVSSNLPQNILAQIWTLVDITKNGLLNLEQFALVNELIKEYKNGVKLPEQLPNHLIPPSLSSNAVISKVSSSTNSLSNLSINNGALPTNPQINELTEEIEKAMKIRRKAEQDLFQLEADTVVKNAEIKNLEIEVQTMNTTVKQLLHQKGEATKRLQDLDNEIVKREGICNENAQRVTEEKIRLNKVKQEISDANDNLNVEEEILRNLVEEVKIVGEKHAKAKAVLSEKNLKIEKLVDELTMMERQTESSDSEIARIEKMSNELEELIKKINKAEENEDDNNKESVKKIWEDKEIMTKKFEQLFLGKDGVICPISKFINPSSFVADPFKDDPFKDIDNLKTSLDNDPFASKANGNNRLNDSHFANNFSPQNSVVNEGFADFSKFANFT